MNRYICDTCHRQEAPVDNYVPHGWFSVSRRYDPKHPTLAAPGDQQHFCSAACSVTYLRAVADAEIVRTEVA